MNSGKIVADGWTGGRVDGRTDKGSIRGPRGPKKYVFILSDVWKSGILSHIKSPKSPSYFTKTPSLQNLDKNNDGFLTKREFSKLLQHLTKEQVLALI